MITPNVSGYFIFCRKCPPLTYHWPWVEGPGSSAALSATFLFFDIFPGGGKMLVHLVALNDEWFFIILHYFSHSFLEQSRGYICQQKLSTVRKQLIPTKIEARRKRSDKNMCMTNNIIFRIDISIIAAQHSSRSPIDWDAFFYFFY